MLRSTRLIRAMEAARRTQSCRSISSLLNLPHRKIKKSIRVRLITQREVPPLILIRGKACIRHASFLDTASKKKKDKFRQPKEWIVPANPKYYDIEAAFDATDEIDWMQGAGIIKGDTVFMYVGAPVSAILYKCKVTEVDIPYDYEDKNLKITALMKIKLLKRYKRGAFTFEKLKSEYGIYAVRGPRGIPHSLSVALK